jgi:hypothetical protein
VILSDKEDRFKISMTDMNGVGNKIYSCERVNYDDRNNIEKKTRS